MTPPVIGGHVQPHAPFSQWQQDASFETANECNKQLGSNVSKIGGNILSAIRQHPEMPAADRNQLVQHLTELQLSQRIASDDPRLK
jgi:hypothetical protein